MTSQFAVIVIRPPQPGRQATCSAIVSQQLYWLEVPPTGAAVNRRNVKRRMEFRTRPPNAVPMSFEQEGLPTCFLPLSRYAIVPWSLLQRRLLCR